MEYRKFGDTYAIRLDRGEEILTCLTTLCEKEDIRLGHATGLGAIDHLVAGLYEVDTREYVKSTFDGEAEIVSLIGNITRMDGKVYLHFHIAASDESGATVGGHLNEARISATAEIFLTSLPGEVGRKKDDAVTGLNLLDFQ